MLEGFDSKAATFAADVDRAFWITNAISLAMFLLIVGAMLWFLYRYHHSRVKPEEIENIKDHVGLEVLWTVVPTLLLFVIFYYGYTAFREIRTMPENAFEVDVLGKRWSWTFTYPNGKKSTELYVPLNEKIRLRLHAPVDDVLHSFYVPAFRIKEDVVPGRETALWFQATVPGRYDVECAEYCGTRHSYMLSKVEVLEQAAFDDWYASDKLTPHDQGPPKEEGENLYNTLGCAACHSLDGSVIVGPSFRGIFGKKVKVATGGKTRELVRDEAYIQRSIMTPSADVVDGFADGLMPNLSDQIDAKQLEALVAFIKKQAEAAEPAPVEEQKKKPEKAAPPPAPAGKPDGQTLFRAKGCIGCHSLDGSRRIGPSLKGVYQSARTVTTDGKSRRVTADEAYLTRSILEPNADVVEGFNPGMMPPIGKSLSPEALSALVEYLKEIR